MMASTLGLPFPGSAYPPYATDFLLDDLSTQMSASQAARRLSRGSNGQRSGTAMRITKPSSASNSPRSSMVLFRRKTLLNEGNLVRREQQIMDHVVTPLPLADISTEPTPRPVSWHPTSSNVPQHPIQIQAPTHQCQPHTQGRVNDVDIFVQYHQMSPMKASYSCHTSPSTFSPLALPLSDFNAQPNLHDAWGLPSHSTPGYLSPALESSLSYAETFPVLSSVSTDGSRSSSTGDWNSFVLHGFNRTSPPTPENLPRMQEPKTAVPDESIPYQPLGEAEEEEGEILVGMGLYDAPDKYDDDLGLNNYRSTLSSLLGGNRGQESPGKGLKLEERWEPPESEEDDDDDDDDDNDEDDQEEEEEEENA